MTSHMPPERVIQRVQEKVVVQSNGCHRSTYSVGSHGYAQVGWREDGRYRMTLCHLVIWRAHHGFAAQGMTVDHECRNRRCVRLECLRLLSNLENARRTDGRDWPLGQCINGHDDAVHWRPAGPERKKGYCELCAAKAQAAYAARVRTERLAS